MSADHPGPTFSPETSRSTHTPPHEDAHTCNPQVSQITQEQGESTLYRPKSATAEKYRRHSTDGSVSGQGLGEPGRFHPYRRQYSDGPRSNYPPHDPRPFVCFQGMEIPEILDTTQPHQEQEEDLRSWDPYSGSLLASESLESEPKFPEVPATSEESPCYPTQIHSAYSSLLPLQQFPGDLYSAGAQLGRSQFAFPCSAPQNSQDATLQSLYPKPIYSYSILIFMALRNSKTGSLPVSEIYSFMTDNFPYFKTAPDGWKNSVRHNLSLNKCFEKVENKSGNSSRKGCLWALNPAKVEKMQEELHKWRRKDPLTVRRSMARPEELDRLLGDRPEKLKPFPSQPTLSSNRGQTALLRGTPPCFNLPRPAHAHPPSLHSHSHHLTPSSHPFPYYCPSRQPPTSVIPPKSGRLESPRLVQVQPTYSAALQSEPCSAKSMQELLLEAELSHDIDAINPSLTDFQLNGHLWEELKDDSLASESLGVIATSPSHAGSAAGAELEEGGSLSDLHITGLYSAAFTSVDGMDSYLPARGTTPVTLL